MWVFCIPVIRGILVPIIYFLLKCQFPRTGLLPNDAALLRTQDALAELDIFLILALAIRHGVVGLAQALPLEHALVVPAAQAQAAQAADEVRNDVVEVEFATVG